MMQYLFILASFILLSCVLSSESLLDGEKNTASSEKKSKDNSSPFTELLGETLYRWKMNADDTMEVEELPTVDLLKGKTAVAIYFSASWCGPCKQFTPVLAQLYKSLNKKGKKFEVVWLSRDRSSEEFLGYYQQMPWLAVTLQNLQPILEKIAPKYQLKGIPHLVILDGDDATVITLSGTQMVAKDQYGLEYPWRARTLINMMPKPLRRLLKNQINQVMGVLQGMLEGVAPGRVVGWIKVQAIALLEIAKKQVVAFIKAKMDGPVAAGGGGGAGGREESNRASRQQQQKQQQQQMQVVDDIEYSNDAVELEERELLAV